eukprot:5652512-Amphidinium_carterae.2
MPPTTVSCKHREELNQDTEQCHASQGRMCHDCDQINHSQRTKHSNQFITKRVERVHAEVWENTHTDTYLKHACVCKVRHSKPEFVLSVLDEAVLHHGDQVT